MQAFVKARPRRHAGLLLRNHLATLVAIAGMLVPPSAMSGSFSLWDVDVRYKLDATYGISTRLEDPSNRSIMTGGRESVPISDFLKLPESNNFDDGNRNFEKGALVNNRATLLGDMEFRWGDYGLVVRGDAFYDDVYSRENDHDAPFRINTTQQPINTFTEEAERFSKARARFLDSYLYGTFYIGETALQVRLGRHIAAWGQTLFFSGTAITMATADATKATVPGADVKSILLPTKQASFKWALTDRINLLGQYRWEHKPFELNPVGEFYSVADVVGPGAEFAYGIGNPFHPDIISQLCITCTGDLASLVDTINVAFGNQLPAGPLTAGLGMIPGGLLPEIGAPGAVFAPLNAPRFLNPIRAEDIDPPKSDQQYGFGMEYQLNDTTLVGAYYHKYHSNAPTVSLNLDGDLVLIPAQEVVNLGGGANVTTPTIRAIDLGLLVPGSYNIRYFDNIDLYAVGLSTIAFGWNVGAEVVRREGIDVLVDVDQGINGLVPTPTRADSNQFIINGIYTMGPKFFWDTFTAVIEWGYVHVDEDDITPQVSITGTRAGESFTGLTDGITNSSHAVASLFFIDKRNIFPGWDLQIPISFQRQIRGRSALAGGFGSLFGERDTRFGIGFNFTRLQKLTMGISYSAFTGADPHFFDAPLADRDTVSFSMKYSIF